MARKSNQTTMLEHALSYARQGWAVFPCYTNKTPMTANGHKNGTTDEVQITEWWTRHPDASIGFALPSDIVVVDVDIKEGKCGDESLAKWEQENGTLPKTVTSLTGGGGRQHFFTTDTPVKCRTGVLPYLDIKTQGGYVILPPSAHPSGQRYKWEKGSEPEKMSMVPLPQSLIGLIMAEQSPRPLSISGEISVEIPEGKRDDTLYRLACSLRQKGLSEDAILAAISQVNQEQCKPPLPDSDVRRIAKGAAKHEQGNLSGSTDPNQKTQAETLFKLVENTGAIFFHDELETPCVAIQINSHREIWPIDSSRFKKYMNQLFYKATDKGIPDEAWKQFVAVLEGMALYDGEMNPLAVRAVEHDGSFWYDLTDPEWRAVCVNPMEWQIIENPPILFKRYPHQAAQVSPQPKGDIRKILKYINVKEDHTLLLCWLVSCFVPDIPHPMPILYGEKGAAKSTTCTLLKSLIDPSKLKTMTLQKDSRSLTLNLQKHWLLAFDNVSYMGEETSDALCRAITGDGIQQRKLYTNDEDVIFSFQRCIVINGINNVATRSDLLDRSILIELKRIPKEERREASVIEEEFEADLPAILGGIFEVLSKAMAIHPTVELSELPRMADFARWGYAIGEALGGKGQEFLDQYAANYNKQNFEAIQADPVAILTVELMKIYAKWNGTMGELYSRLKLDAYKYNINPQNKSFPPDPSRLSRRLNAIKSNLEAVGITLETKQKSDGTHVSLERRDLPSLPPYHHNPSDDGNGSNGSKNLLSRTGSKPDADLPEDS